MHFKHCYIAILLTGLSCSQPASSEQLRFSTYGLTPQLKINPSIEKVSLVECLIDIGKGSQESCVLTVYNGQPEFNSFGDLDLDRLEKREFKVRLVTVDLNREDKPRLPFEDDRDSSHYSLYSIESEELKDLHWKLAISSVKSAKNRLLIPSTNKRPIKADSENFNATFSKPQHAYIIPLASITDQPGDSGASRRDLGNLSMYTDTFRRSKPDRYETLLEPEGEFAYIRLNTSDGKLILTEDRNHFHFNEYGRRTFQTLIGFGPLFCSLIELHEPDPLQQGRRLFRCEFTPFGPLPNLNKSKMDLETRLVLHPSSTGAHRLIRLNSGKIQQIIPLFEN